MKVVGTAVFRASAESVYAALIDPSVLAVTIPGCEQVKQVDRYGYQMTVSAGIGSIRGRYQVSVRLVDVNGAPYALAIRASGTGLPGNFSADVHVVMADSAGASTSVTYTAEVTVGGAIGALGRHILTRAGKKSAAQFFVHLDRVLTAGAVKQTVPLW
jgi:carbon monoxide dehydrogenase subunit G